MADELELLVIDRELRRLAEDYAFAADTRDADRFLSVFAADAELSVFESDSEAPASTFRGHAELRAIPGVLARFVRTFHVIGNANYEIDMSGARGYVYCIAHHLSVDGETSTDTVMYIRYDDEYARQSDDSWRIRRRAVRKQWVDVQPLGNVSS